MNNEKDMGLASGKQRVVLVRRYKFCIECYRFKDKVKCRCSNVNCVLGNFSDWFLLSDF